MQPANNFIVLNIREYLFMKIMVLNVLIPDRRYRKKQDRMS